jgi:hypothetical protein
MFDWLDESLYPDSSPPESQETISDQVDFLARSCAAWDFDFLPEQQSILEIRKPAWREAVDLCRMLTSPTYHLPREWRGLAPEPFLGQKLAYILDDPDLEHV